MPLYLYGIGIANQEYQNTYFIEDHFWRHSNICKILGLISCLSLEMSLITQVYLSVFYTYIANKVHNQISPAKIGVTCVSFWIGEILLASVPLLFDFIPTSGYCLFFHLGRWDNHLMWYYCLTVFIFFNSILLLFLMVSSCKTMVIIFRSYKRVASQGHISGGKSPSRAFVLLSAPLVFSMAFWIPLQGLLASSLAGEKYDPVLIGWIIIFMLPFNSLINPNLHTFRVLVSKLKRNKKQ